MTREGRCVCVCVFFWSRASQAPEYKTREDKGKEMGLFPRSMCTHGDECPGACSLDEGTALMGEYEGAVRAYTHASGDFGN